jgi:hypothetical protein
MSATHDHEQPVLNVHVKSSDVPPAAPRPAQAPPASFYTVVLTEAFPVRLLLPLAPNREWAIVQAFDNDVVLCDTQGQAQDPANADSTLAAPQGGLLATGVVLPLRNRNEVFVTAAAFPSRVSVIAAYRD